MRMRASGESAMLTASTFACAMRRAPSMTLRVLMPRGGSISTLTTNFSRSLRNSEGSSRSAGGAATAGPGSSTRTSAPGASFSAGRWDSSRSRMARMWAAVVPQQPPTMRTPSATARAANSAKYSGLARYRKRPSTNWGSPAFGMAETGVPSAAAISSSSTSSVGCGPTPQLIPTTSAPACLSARTTSDGVCA